MVTQRSTEWEAPKLVSVAEAARLLGIGERQAWKMIARQELRSIRFAGRRLVARAEVDRIAATAQEC